ncbi:hypothetical protein NPIL_32421, partial [Nephila pilipes]
DKEGLFRSPKQPRKDVNISLPISNPFDALTQQQDNSQDIPPNLQKPKDYLAVSGGHSTCTFDEFVNVDENLITAQLQEIGDIAAEILVNGGDKGEEMDNDKEEDTTTAKILPTHTAAL